MDIRGKTAVITGGAKRIGREISLALAKEGVNLFIHYSSSEEEAQRTKSECEEFGVRVRLVRADFSTPDIKDVIYAVRKSDILINNASSFRKSELEKLDVNEIEHSIRTNFTIPFILTKELWLSKKKKNEKGHVINMLDAVSVRKNYIPYHIGKEMLKYLVERISVYFAPEVQVNGVALGPVLPPEGEGEEYLDKLVEKTPLKRRIDVQEITDAVVFLLKNTSITGQVIYIAGGEQIIKR